MSQDEKRKEFHGFIPSASPNLREEQDPETKVQHRQMFFSSFLFGRSVARNIPADSIIQPQIFFEQTPSRPELIGQSIVAEHTHTHTHAHVTSWHLANRGKQKADRKTACTE